MCQCRFCAWCFEDCGNSIEDLPLQGANAPSSIRCQAHVGNCDQKPEGTTDAFFAPFEDWSEFHRSRRLRLIEAYIAALDEELGEHARQDCADILQELRVAQD